MYRYCLTSNLLCHLMHNKNWMFCSRFNKSVEGLDRTSCTEINNRLLPNKRIKTHCIPNANGFSWSSTHLKLKNHTLDSPHPKHSYNSNKHTHLTLWVTKTSKISKYSICHVLVKTFLTHPCIFFLNASIIIKQQNWKLRRGFHR